MAIIVPLIPVAGQILFFSGHTRSILKNKRQNPILSTIIGSQSVQYHRTQFDDTPKYPWSERECMDESNIKGLDEIDRILIRLLSQNPRQSYKELTRKLADRGHEMTSEGVRYRVQRLLEFTSVFFMLEPAVHGWEIVRYGIEVANEPGALETVYDAVFETDVWLVCVGYGSYDLWAIATTESNEGIRSLLTEIRSIEHVENVHHFVETGRQTDLTRYLIFGES